MVPRYVSLIPHVYICKLKGTYFFLSRSHLSFPLHLASGNTCKLPGHRSGPVDWNRMPLGSLHGRDDLDRCDALVSRLLCNNLDFGPFGGGLRRGISRIHFWSINWIFCSLHRKRQAKVVHSVKQWAVNSLLCSNLRVIEVERAYEEKLSRLQYKQPWYKAAIQVFALYIIILQPD